MAENDSLEKEKKSSRNLIVTWGLVSVIGSGVFFVCSLAILMIYSFCNDEQWLEMGKEHSAASVGIPLAIVIAFLLVSILQVTSGKIEFQALGFKFSGASGPIIMWIACFLSMIVALRLLW